jgi:hypothetical protein
MKRKGNLTYTSSRTKTGFKTYNIPTLNKEIIVPNLLFELTKTMSNYCFSNNSKEIVKLKFKDGKFIKQNN